MSQKILMFFLKLGSQCLTNTQGNIFWANFPWYSCRRFEYRKHWLIVKILINGFYIILNRLSLFKKKTLVKTYSKQQKTRTFQWDLFWVCLVRNDYIGQKKLAFSILNFDFLSYSRPGWFPKDDNIFRCSLKKTCFRNKVFKFKKIQYWTIFS